MWSWKHSHLVPLKLTTLKPNKKNQQKTNFKNNFKNK